MAGSGGVGESDQTRSVRWRVRGRDPRPGDQVHGGLDYRQHIGICLNCELECAIGEPNQRVGDDLWRLRRVERREQHHVVVPDDHVVALPCGDVIQVVPHAGSFDRPVCPVLGGSDSVDIADGPPGVVQIAHPVPAGAIGRLHGLPSQSVGGEQDASLAPDCDECAGGEGYAGQALSW